MKSRIVTPYLLLCLFVMLSQFSFATVPNKALINKDGINAVETEANTTVVPTKTLTKKQIRKQAKKAKKESKLQKRIAKFKKKMAAIDFSDPVNKWMWFWIFGWAAGLALYIIGVASLTTGTIGGFGILGLLGALCTLFGTVSLIIWLVKKFS